MKISFKENKNPKFKDLKPGDVFKNYLSNYLVKLDTKDAGNAVCLSDGSIFCYEDEHNVILVNAEIVVHE